MAKYHFFSISTFLVFMACTHSVQFNEKNLQQTSLELKRQEEIVYMLKQDCGSCHGMNLKGGLGPALLPENLHTKSDEYLFNTIYYGRNSKGMPPWKRFFKPEELTWLVRYLKE